LSYTRMCRKYRHNLGRRGNRSGPARDALLPQAVQPRKGGRRISLP